MATADSISGPSAYFFGYRKSVSRRHNTYTQQTLQGEEHMN